jgi:hypothetical protein
VSKVYTFIYLNENRRTKLENSHCIKLERVFLSLDCVYKDCADKLASKGHKENYAH